MGLKSPCKGAPLVLREGDSSTSTHVGYWHLEAIQEADKEKKSSKEEIFSLMFVLLVQS